MDQYLETKLQQTRFRIKTLSKYKQMYDNEKTGSEINCDIEEILQELNNEKHVEKQLKSKIAGRIKGRLFNFTPAPAIITQKTRIDMIRE